MSDYSGKFQKYDSKINCYSIPDPNDAAFDEVIVVGNNDYAFTIYYDADADSIEVTIYGICENLGEEGNIIERKVFKDAHTVQFPKCRNMVFSNAKDAAQGPFRIIDEYGIFADITGGDTHIGFSRTGQVTASIIGCTVFISN